MHQESNNNYNEYYNECYGGSFLRGERFRIDEYYRFYRSENAPAMRSILGRAYADATNDRAVLSDITNNQSDVQLHMTYIASLRSFCDGSARRNMYFRSVYEFENGDYVIIGKARARAGHELKILKCALDFVETEQSLRRPQVPVSQTAEFKDFILAP